jgi:hypothetical protein
MMFKTEVNYVLEQLQFLCTDEMIRYQYDHLRYRYEISYLLTSLVEPL